MSLSFFTFGLPYSSYARRLLYEKITEGILFFSFLILLVSIFDKGIEEGNKLKNWLQM